MLVEGKTDSFQLKAFNATMIQLLLKVLLCVWFCAVLSNGATNKDVDAGYFWHVSDMHYDFTYSVSEPGGSCGDGADDRNLGDYGDYLCDSPWKLIISAVDAMHYIWNEPDFLIWTGDDTPHIYDDDFLNQAVVLDILENLTTILQDKWPDTKVYSALGNHDWSPKHQLPPRPDPFYDDIAELWSDWLDNNDEAEVSFRIGGYYTLSENTDLRVVVLNTNLYYESNLLTKDMHDPAGQLQWLDDVLIKAAEEEEKVMIVAHVPPGKFEKHRDYHWMYPFYNEAFLRLLRKHKDVISSVHMAHHHTDSFRILYDEEGEPAVPLFLGPSVTPWETTLPGVIGGAGNNPSIRLVQYDRKTGAVLDLHQYYLNLTKANLDGEAEWTLEYNATQYFGVPDMSSSSLDQYSSSWLTDTEGFDKYYTINGVKYDINEKCTGLCKFVQYCSVRNLNYEDYNACVEKLVAETNTSVGLNAWSSFILILVTAVFVIMYMD